MLRLLPAERNKWRAFPLDGYRMADDAARSDLFEQLAAAFAANESAGRDLESRLVRQAQAGDRDAFGALYRQHVSTVYRYCWLHTGGPRETVEDLTSTVFLRAWRSIDRYEERGRPFAAWLHTIARNVVIDHQRQSGQTVPLDLTLPATYDTAAEAVSRLEYRQLHAALLRLTEEQRTVVVHRFLLGYSGEETAAIMGKRAGAIRALQLRALQQLRHLLEPDTL